MTTFTVDRRGFRPQRPWRARPPRQRLAESLADLSVRRPRTEDVRRVVVLALGSLLLLSSCGPAERRASETGTVVHRYGISINAPEGWDATITRGAVRAANFPLPPPVGQPLGEVELLLQLFETDPEADSPLPDLSLYPKVDAVPTLATHDFRPPEPGTQQVAALARRTFSVAGRLFVLFAESGTKVPPAAALVQLDELLATMSIDPGDFYPGSVDPPGFAPRDGWHVGDSGPRPVRADGNFVSAWASTSPYLDAWNMPHADETLRVLPEDGIVLWIGLFTTNRFAPPAAARGPDMASPLRLADFERRAAWEGQVRDLPEYILWATIEDEYEVDARVFFGRAVPTPAMEQEANAMLAGLQLPDWPRWN